MSFSVFSVKQLKLTVFLFVFLLTYFYSGCSALQGEPCIFRAHAALQQQVCIKYKAVTDLKEINFTPSHKRKITWKGLRHSREAQEVANKGKHNVEAEQVLNVKWTHEWHINKEWYWYSFCNFRQLSTNAGEGERTSKISDTEWKWGWVGVRKLQPSTERGGRDGGGGEIGVWVNLVLVCARETTGLGMWYGDFA